MKNRRTGKFQIVLAAVCMMLTVLGGCGSEAPATSDKPAVYEYFLNADEDGLYKKEYREDVSDGQKVLEDFLVSFNKEVESNDYKPLLTNNVKILDYKITDRVLTLNFSSEYEKLSSTREVLARAGIVRTLMQIEGIDGVRFAVNSGDAHSPSGEILGLMTANSFVEDAGKQVNAVQNDVITLYFANQDGTALRQESRSIYYSASKPLEWAIVERVIAGPKVAGNYATVSPNTSIINVNKSNGVCYVNLSSSFVTGALSVKEEIPIYSIVNSLTEDCPDVSLVQIAIEGDSNRVFISSVDLSQPFESDMSYLEKE